MMFPNLSSSRLKESYSEDKIFWEKGCTPKKAGLQGPIVKTSL